MLTNFKPFVILTGLFWLCCFQSAYANEQQLLLLIEYVAVDYSEAIQEGKVINPAEYQEMLEFSDRVNLLTEGLKETDQKQTLLAVASELRLAVRAKLDPATIRIHASELRETLIDAYDVLVMPKRKPDLNNGREMYERACASCHGDLGGGDGIASASLDPPATNFLDLERYNERTLSGLFNTISLGVEGTAMASFSQLSEAERWSLAFYVGSLATQATLEPESSHISSMKTLITITPSAANERWGETGSLEMAWLRQDPQKLFQSEATPLEFSHEQLSEVLKLYKLGRFEDAYDQSLTAYLEGFELVEPAMQAVDADFAFDLEKKMGDLRSKLQKRSSAMEVETTIIEIQADLLVAGRLLRTSRLSPETAFSSAIIILLREGLEAMLVVIALITFLQRTGRKDAVIYIHFGWASALVAGLFTWWVSFTLITISGASREMTEGVAALVASGILLYVGFWMHDKSHANNWQKFIEDQAGKLVSTGALWGLTGLAFIAVYREVFETILFYQALWAQTNGLAQQSVIYGLVVGAALLIVLGFMISRYSKKLPIRQFFTLSSFLMFGLAFVLAGKGVSALQEAGWIDSHGITFVRIDLLGISPYIESLGAQLFILLLGAGYWLSKVRRKR